MAITVDRIIGKGITVDFGGITTDWSDYDLTYGGSEDGANAADAENDQVVLTKEIFSGNVKGLMGSNNNGGTLPVRGDVITLTALKGADAILPDMSSYGDITVTSVNYSGGAGPHTFTMNFRSGVLTT